MTSLWKSIYFPMGHVAITSYTDHDLNSESRNECGEEYATIPDKEPSELGSVCSIGSVNSIGSVESIGSVDSVFSSNSSTDVESLLESDEEQNDDSNNVEYCNDWSLYMMRLDLSMKILLKTIQNENWRTIMKFTL